MLLKTLKIVALSILNYIVILLNCDLVLVIGEAELEKLEKRLLINISSDTAARC
jgi:hypothetical protein